jgi:hypothetical protein
MLQLAVRVAAAGTVAARAAIGSLESLPLFVLSISSGDAPGDVLLTLIWFKRESERIEKLSNEPLELALKLHGMRGYGVPDLCLVSSVPSAV